MTHKDSELVQITKSELAELSALTYVAKHLVDQITQSDIDNKIDLSIGAITEILKRNKLTIYDNEGWEHTVSDKALSDPDIVIVK